MTFCVLCRGSVESRSHLSGHMFMGIGLLGSSKGRDLEHPYVRLDGGIYILYLEPKEGYHP